MGRQYTGSKILIHNKKENFLTIKLPAELKAVLLKDTEQRGGWGHLNRLAVEILAKHYNRLDLAYVPTRDGGRRTIRHIDGVGDDPLPSCPAPCDR